MPIVLLLVLATAPRQAEAKVREAIATLEKALVAKDESVGDLIELPRLLREMERRGSIPDAGQRFRGVRRLEENMSALVAGPGYLAGGWNRIEPLSVKVSGDEAEVFCRVTLGARKCKFRLWLGREGDAWRTFDLENLDGSYRLSVIGLQYAPGVHDDDDRQSLRDGVMALQRGAVYLSKGQAEGARDAMSMARRCTPPPYVMDWIDLVDGQALSALGDPAAALKAADRALVRQKDLAVAHRLKAACHAALNEPEKAVAAAKDYLKLVVDDADLWTLMGRAYEKLDQKDEAVEAYRKGADCDAQDVASRLELGRLLLDRRQAADALAFLTAAVRLDPAEFERAADDLDLAGAHAEVLALGDEAALRRADESPLLHRRGRALRRLGRLKEAEEALRRACTIHLDDPALPRELLLTLAQSGKDAEAQERLRTVAGGAGWSHAYVRAFVHAAAGRSAPALEELKTVVRAEEALRTSVAGIDTEAVFEKLRAEPFLVAARATRDYWQARGRPSLTPEQAMKTAQDRIQAAPDHALAHADLGRALRRLRRHADAEAAIRKAIDLSDDKTGFQDDLGRALAAQGKLDEALAVADGMKESGLDLRVSVFAIAGKREAALKELRTLLDKHPAWHASAMAGEDLDEFRNSPAVQELLRKARAKVRK